MKISNDPYGDDISPLLFWCQKLNFLFQQEVLDLVLICASLMSSSNDTHTNSFTWRAPHLWYANILLGACYSTSRKFFCEALLWMASYDVVTAYKLFIPSLGDNWRFLAWTPSIVRYIEAANSREIDHCPLEETSFVIIFVGDDCLYIPTVLEQAEQAVAKPVKKKAGTFVHVSHYGKK